MITQKIFQFFSHDYTGNIPILSRCRHQIFGRESEEKNLPLPFSKAVLSAYRRRMFIRIILQRFWDVYEFHFHKNNKIDAKKELAKCRTIFRGVFGKGSLAFTSIRRLLGFLFFSPH